MNKALGVFESALSSNRGATNKLAVTPHLFGEIRQPQNSYLAIPKVSSENRNYIPMQILQPDIIANGSLLIIPRATLYHFGILTSSIHMAWMKTVCGRLESRYQYSASIVYNTFPWPNLNTAQIAAIEKAAQSILAARNMFQHLTLSDLYGLTPPPELIRAHNSLNRAVVAAYGGPGFTTEAERVADLMKRYQKLVESE